MEPRTCNSYPHNIQQWKRGFYPPGRDGACQRQRHFCCLRVQGFHLQPLTLGFGRVRVVQTGVTWGDSGMGDIGKRHGRSAARIPVISHPPPPISQQPFSIRGTSPSSSSLEKGNYTALEDTGHPTLILNPCWEGSSSGWTHRYGQAQGLSVTGFGVEPLHLLSQEPDWHFPLKGNLRETPGF